MKKALKIGGICIGVFLAIYLFVAFISMEPNPKDWEESARAAYVFFSLATCFGLIGILTAADTF